MVVDVEVNAHPETAITILCRNSCTGHADAEHRPEVNRPVEPQPVISGVSAAKLVGNLQDHRLAERSMQAVHSVVAVC